MIIAPKRRMSSPPTPLRIKEYKGVDLSNTKDFRYSKDELNLILDDDFTPEKRNGRKRIFTDSLGEGRINGLFLFRKINGDVIRLAAHGTKLYTWDDSGDQPTEIYTGLANNKVRSFTVNDKMYFLDGANFLQYDGSSVVDITTIAYAPTLLTGLSPNGSNGNALDAVNLLTPAFIYKYSSDGVATTYVLTGVTNLDATAVEITINGVAKTEGTHFTVDRTAGTINFAAGTAPHGSPVSGTNNVSIKAYKTVAGNADKIKKCTMAIMFGGNNEFKIFLWGNPDYPNRMFRSGTSTTPPLSTNPLYFPDNLYETVGADNDRILNCEIQYDNLVVFKQYSKHAIESYIDTNGNVAFSTRYLDNNNTMGIYAADSLQLINNTPFWLTQNNGVYFLEGGVVKNEDNSKPVSQRIDVRLNTESNRQNAISVDYDGKYMLCLNNNAYVYDYRKDSWHIWSNIPASCFLEYNGYLYFGDNANGLIYRFKKADEDLPYNDDGQIIESYWLGISTSFEMDNWYKSVPKVNYTIKPGSHTSVDLSYVSNLEYSPVISTNRMDLLDFGNLNFEEFTFETNRNPRPVTTKTNIKKIIYFQPKLSNNKLNESFGFTSIEIEWIPQSEVK